MKKRFATTLSQRAMSSKAYRALPELVVFDLDDCLWSPEMYTLSEIPEKVFYLQIRLLKYTVLYFK
jgi:hypothetical protein